MSKPRMDTNGENCRPEKRASRKEILEKKKAVEAIIKTASSLKDHLSYLPEFHHYQINGLFLHLESGRGNKLSIGTKRCIQNLLKLNMEEHFGSEWPTEEKIKRREMVAEAAHYIFVHDISHGDENEVPKSTDIKATCGCKGPIVGFVHYRFSVEEELPVIYLYELQLEPHVQGKGLGKFLMQILELIASKNKMSAVMLTVQRSNLMAMDFYICKLGYTISAISPSRADPLVGPTKSYEILCKTFDLEAHAVLEGQC